jgi:hypothetical protein
MSKKPIDREALNPSLPFPTPAGFGEPIAYLIVAVNGRGESHIHLQGNREQALFLATQGLNYAISGLVVASLQQSLERSVLPWPTSQTGGRS